MRMSTVQEPGGKHGWGPFVTGVGIGVVVIALLVIAFAVGYNLGESRAEERAAEDAATPPPAADTGEGESDAAAATFQQTCGSCHALAAAGTEATVGPDLDALQPTREQVLAAIANGGTGSGAMPADLLSGDDADQVADYVASVAGSGR
jgi:mono/diheme cytochrome c family protein